MRLTYLGHSAFKCELAELKIYCDPYIQEPIHFERLEAGDLVLFSHGLFDHGVLSSPKLWKAWQCKFIGPEALINWMAKKYRKVIPQENLIALNPNQELSIKNITIRAVPTFRPLTHLGKTVHALYTRSSAPGQPGNGYLFEGFYHSGDTLYTPAIATALQGRTIHTACLPIGGKYKTASPQEALRIAEEIKSQRLVPMHWQPLVEQVPFRYRPSHLVKLAKQTNSPVLISPLAIGESIELG